MPLWAAGPSVATLRMLRPPFGSVVNWTLSTEVDSSLLSVCSATDPDAAVTVISSETFPTFMRTSWFNPERVNEAGSVVLVKPFAVTVMR